MWYMYSRSFAACVKCCEVAPWTKKALSWEVDGFIDGYAAIGGGFLRRWTQKGMRGRFESRGTREHNLYGGQIFIATTYTQTPYRGSGRRATATDPSVADSRNYPETAEPRLEPATCSCVWYARAFPRAPLQPFKVIPVSTSQTYHSFFSPFSRIF